MDDLISRQAAIDVLAIGEEFLNRVLDEVDVVGYERKKYEWGLDLIKSYISDMKELPPAQPERKTGRWIVQKDASGKTYGECSACHYKQYAGMLKYCPECGAKMEVEHDT